MSKDRGHSSDIHPDLVNKKDKTNWVEKAGGLPAYIRRIAKHLVADAGMTESHAIAAAVNTVKRWAHGGGGVTPATRAKAAAALAEWEAKRGKARAARGLANPGVRAALELALNDTPKGWSADKQAHDIEKQRQSDWNEKAHPRVKAGNKGGGRFTKKGANGGSTTETASGKKLSDVKKAAAEELKKRRQGATPAAYAAYKKNDGWVGIDDVSEDDWKGLLAAGWKGRPDDGREALYPPHPIEEAKKPKSTKKASKKKPAKATRKTASKTTGKAPQTAKEGPARQHARVSARQKAIELAASRGHHGHGGHYNPLQPRDSKGRWTETPGTQMPSWVTKASGFDTSKSKPSIKMQSGHEYKLGGTVPGGTIVGLAPDPEQKYSQGKIILKDNFDNTFKSYNITSFHNAAALNKLPTGGESIKAKPVASQPKVKNALKGAGFDQYSESKSSVKGWPITHAGYKVTKNDDGTINAKYDPGIGVGANQMSASGAVAKNNQKIHDTLVAAGYKVQPMHDANGEITGVKIHGAHPGGVPPQPVAPAGPSPIDKIKKVNSLDGWTPQAGTQAGSNKGGVYHGPNGEKAYVKHSQTDLHARNEVLAAQLYQMAGVDHADLQLADVGNGKLGTTSAILPNVKNDVKNDLKSKIATDPEYKAKLQEGFATDAWLANWDVAGLTYDNVLTDQNGKPVRIDPGGALLFRAQGAPKGGAFGNSATEWDTLRDSGMNAQSAKLFSGMSDAQLKASAQKVVDISPAQIDAAVDAAGFSPDVSAKLKGTLKARRLDIADRAGIDVPEAKTKAAPEAPATPSVATSDSIPATVKWKGIKVKKNSVDYWQRAHDLTVESRSKQKPGSKTWQKMEDRRLDQLAMINHMKTFNKTSLTQEDWDANKAAWTASSAPSAPSPSAPSPSASPANAVKKQSPDIAALQAAPPIMTSNSYNEVKEVGLEYAEYGGKSHYIYQPVPDVQKYQLLKAPPADIQAGQEYQEIRPNGSIVTHHVGQEAGDSAAPTVSVTDSEKKLYTTQEAVDALNKVGIDTNKIHFANSSEQEAVGNAMKLAEHFNKTIYVAKDPSAPNSGKYMHAYVHPGPNVDYKAVEPDGTISDVKGAKTTASTAESPSNLTSPAQVVTANTPTGAAAQKYNLHVPSPATEVAGPNTPMKFDSPKKRPRGLAAIKPKWRERFEDTPEAKAIEGRFLPTHKDVENHYVASKVKLTGAQKDKIYAYTSSAYNFNDPLRGKTDMTPARADSIRQLDMAAQSYATSAPMVLHRGLNHGSNFPSENLVGKLIQDPAFMSTGVNYSFGGPIQLHMYAPAGTHGISMHGVFPGSGGSHGNEKEFLLPRGTTIMVSKDEVIDGERHITATIVPMPKSNESFMGVVQVPGGVSAEAYSPAGLDFLRVSGRAAWAKRYAKGKDLALARKDLTWYNRLVREKRVRQRRALIAGRQT